MNECSDAAVRLVTCVETPGGFFVPVGQPTGLCSYRLWFVPRAPEDQLVALSEVFEEFDIAFTVRLQADDLDADKDVELLLVRGWAHPEGVGESQAAYLVDPSGTQSRLPFADFKDVDTDGRLDAILSFTQTTNASECEPPDSGEVWAPRSINGPELVLHRLAGAKFSLTDDVSRRARARSCGNLGTSVVMRRGGQVDEDETLRRAVCQLADGGDPAATARALTGACSRDHEAPADCTKRRSGVCFWRSMLLNVPVVFEAIQPWLEVPRPVR